MKPGLKERWIKALRSGDFKQGQTQLHSADNRFCCLGVLAALCDLNRSHRLGSCVYTLPDGTQREELRGIYLDDDQLVEVGLSRADQSTLANMNDEGRTFQEIADFIEQTIDV